MDHLGFLCKITREQVDQFDPSLQLSDHNQVALHVAVRAFGNERLARAEDKEHRKDRVRTALSEALDHAQNKHVLAELAKR